MQKKFYFSSIFLLLLSFILNAQDGTLDLSFNSTGKVLTSIGTFDESGFAVTVKEDKLNPSNYLSRRIVVAGQTYNGSGNYDFMVARYNDDGSLDNTFGGTGVVTTDFSNYDDKARAVLIQDDGKIVVGGFSTNGSQVTFALLRLKSNGTLDSTFGTNGKVTTAIGSKDDNILSMSLQNDGKIVAAGYSDNGNNLDFAVARYDVSGNLDATFDTDGKVTTSLGSGADVAYGVVIQNDGKIVLGGHSFQSTNQDFALVRYNSNGSLDNTFDGDGKVTTAINGTHNEYAFSLDINSAGKLILAGYSANTYVDFVLTQYDNTGALDVSFGNNGIVYTDFGTLTDYAQATTVLVQSNDKILVGGYQNDGAKLNYALVRYKVSGAVDSTFGTNGIVTTDFSGNDDEGMSLALQNDGKILLAGGSHDGNKKHFAIARYENSITASVFEFIEQSAQIYPNPFSSLATVITDFNLYNAKVEVYNVMGEKLMQLNNVSGNSFQIQGENWAKGIYMLNTIQENGNVIRALLVLN